MITKSLCFFVLATSLWLPLASGLQAQIIPRRNRTRPCPQYCLPSNNYKIVKQSAPITAISDVFVYMDDPLDGTGNGVSANSTTNSSVTTNRTVEDGKQIENTIKEETTVDTEKIAKTPRADSVALERKVKLFQWSEDQLKIDHCSISRMAVQVHRDGSWNLNLRADQNPRSTTTGNARRFNPTLHIKRNRFSIRLRCYANTGANKSGFDGISTGKPLVTELTVKDFWVENGQPKYVLERGFDPLISKQFDSIERVQIEFVYHK